MKIRINGNSIRLRLSQSEVEVFGKRGKWSQVLNFPNGHTLTYSLCEGTDTLVSYAQDTVTIVLCEEEAETWVNTDQVGVKAELSLPNGDKLSILVEKDFKCLTNREEDQSDMYPNPKDSH
jgi:hypothetical protein